MDIVIPDDRIGDFFFMNDEEEEKQFGTSADYKQAAALTQQLIKNASKGPQKQAAENRNKQMMDFKVRAVDFLSIYVKQRAYQSDPSAQIKLIRGLLKGLSAANVDKHQILFERIKSVLALMAKQGQTAAGQSTSTQEGSNDNETKSLLTEVSRLVLKPQREPAVQKAYADCFLLLIKHYYDSGDAGSREQLVAIFKDLLAKFLSGRILAGSGLNIRLLQTAFEQCPSLAWSLHS